MGITLIARLTRRVLTHPLLHITLIGPSLGLVGEFERAKHPTNEEPVVLVRDYTPPPTAEERRNALQRTAIGRSRAGHAAVH